MSCTAQAASNTNTGLYIENTATTILMEWDQPNDKATFEYFEIKYKEKSESKFNVKNIRQTEHNKITLCNLKSDTNYDVKGFIVENTGSRLIFDKDCKTNASCTQQLIKLSTQVWKKPPIYKLPCLVSELEKNCLREINILEKYQQPTIEDANKEKTILVVGSTGSGKSTLIDAMINHLVDVPFGDEYRFKMIDLTDGELKTSGEEVVSQTSTTTCYRIPRHAGFSIDFPLNIIDTPGFDDTRGISFDKEIPIQIRKLFESVIQRIHAVCIVVPLSNTRLTEAQKYVFKNILDLFGVNIKNIIYPCITHDDGGELKCLSALEVAGVPFKKYFRFNNSDLFSEKPSKTPWNDRQKTFTDLFFEIEKAEPQCLKSSEFVLKVREMKTLQLQSIQNKIRVEVQRINTMRNEERVLKKFESEIESNKDFTYEECVSEKVKKKSKNRSVNCNVCKESCHKNCYVPFDMFLSFCEVFSDGNCTVCKSECTTDRHDREKFVYETVFVNVKRTKQDLEKKYKDAVQRKEKQNSILQNERHELQKSLKELKKMLKHVELIIAAINVVALQREKFSIEKYLDEIIDLEHNKKEADFAARMDFISKMKKAMEDDSNFEKRMFDMWI